MKNFIKQKLNILLEAYKELPYNPKPEMDMGSGGKYHTIGPLSDKFNESTKKYIIDKIRSSEQLANNQDVITNEYLKNPYAGFGTYKVVISRTGKITTQLTTATGNMPNQGNTDIGNFKTSIKEPFVMYVKAGIEKEITDANGNQKTIVAGVKTTPADDAAIKALIYFKKDILGWMSDSSGYVDSTAADVSKEKMNDKETQHKQKKDLEKFFNRRLSDSDWYEVVIAMNQLRINDPVKNWDKIKQHIIDKGFTPPKEKQELSYDQEKLDAAEKRRELIKAKLKAKGLI